jgi:hypothetical protein
MGLMGLMPMDAGNGHRHRCHGDLHHTPHAAASDGVPVGTVPDSIQRGRHGGALPLIVQYLKRARRRTSATASRGARHPASTEQTPLSANETALEHLTMAVRCRRCDVGCGMRVREARVRARRSHSSTLPWTSCGSSNQVADVLYKSREPKGAKFDSRWGRVFELSRKQWVRLRALGPGLGRAVKWHGLWPQSPTPRGWVSRMAHRYCITNPQTVQVAQRMPTRRRAYAASFGCILSSF